MENMEAGGRQAAHDREANDDIASSMIESESDLHKAVWKRAEDQVENLKYQPRLARERNINGMPPLYLAIYLGYGNIAEKLIETFGSELSFDGPDGQSVLHVAALRSRDLTSIILGRREYLRNVADNSRSTPLHFAASVGVEGVTGLLLEGDHNNKSGIYQQDSKGMCPIHIAASVGAMDAVRALVHANDYSCATLRDRNGGTFLHVAVEHKKTDVVEFVCKEPRLESILNIKDKNGNTALHLAVKKRRESIFSHLLGNRHVELNHVNMEGYTPLDLASNIKKQHPFASLQNPTEWMIRALAHSGGHFGARRRDNNPATAHGHEVNLAQSTESVLVASALIATLTFAAAFTMPGSYKADGHPKAGTPALGGHYGFKVFLVADMVAFFCSVAATFSLAEYGNRGNVEPLVRCVYAQRAVRLFHVGAGAMPNIT